MFNAKTRDLNIKTKRPVTNFKSKIAQHELQKKEEENQKELTTKTDIGWGHQIRSYVLQPYQLVKDLRNKIESYNPTSILDGNIDIFIEEGIKIKK